MPSERRRSVLFVGKPDDPHVLNAAARCRELFSEVTVCLGGWGTPLPPEAANWQGDVLISYLGRWVIPPSLLARAGAAINFHPAPPEYPGVGCMNFALYEDAPQYGVTCHHMAPRVDTGAIIEVDRFPIRPADDVASLLERTYERLFALFQKYVGDLAAGHPLPRSDERWGRRAYTRVELNALAEITPDMSADEVRRRIRATTFGAWKPTVRLHQYVFELKRS